MKMKKRCHSCDNRALQTTRYCLRCYIKETVRKTLHVTDQQEKEHYASLLLKKLQLQNFECVYTGRQLVPGKNLSLDHILPSSVYPEGLKELDNLVWVDLSCNIAKNNLLPENFLALCEDVVVTKSSLLSSNSLIIESSLQG